MNSMSELSVNHLLGIKNLNSSDINLIFDFASKFKEVISRPIIKGCNYSKFIF